MRILLGFCVLFILSGFYSLFKKSDSFERPDYLNAYSFDEFIKHFKYHVKLIRTTKNIPLVLLLAGMLAPVIAAIRLFNCFIFFVTFLKYLKKYINNDNLIIFPKIKLRINPCITTSEFLYQIFFVIPSAGGYRSFYAIASFLAKKTKISKES